MSEVPTEHSELVELIENNDPGVAAGVIQENFTANEELHDLISDFEELSNMNDVENPTMHEATKVAIWNLAADLTEDAIEGKR